MWLGTASLLRAGHTLLDRLVIAGGVLAGLLIAEGVLFSFWPWGLGVVPVGGFTLTVLALIGAWLFYRSGLRPQIPVRVRGSDLIVLAAPIVMWELVHRPTAGKTFGQALPAMAGTPDGLNHFALFDTIHRIGGYQFFRPSQAAASDGRMGFYPPGSHYLYALLDIFRVSSSDAGDVRQEFLRFFQYRELSVCLLALTVVWATRWIAGPLATGWHRTLVCAVVAGFVVFGQLSTLFFEGFNAEVLSLALLAVAVAVISRPPARTREQILVGAALAVAVAFTYPIFAVQVGMCGMAALLVYKVRIRRAKTVAALVALPTLALMVLPVAESYRYADSGHLLSEGGGFVPLSRPLCLAFAVIALSVLTTRSGRRLPAWRVMSVTVALAWIVALYAEAVGSLSVGAPQYYSSKFDAAAFVVSLCGFGAIAAHLKPVTRVTGAGFRPLLQRLAPGSLSIALALALSHGFPGAGVKPIGGASPDQTSIAVLWATGNIKVVSMPPIADYARVGGLGDGVRTVFVASDRRETNLYMTVALAVMNRSLSSLDGRAMDSRSASQQGDPVTVPDVDQAFVTMNDLPGTVTENNLSDAQEAAWTKVQAWLGLQPPGLRMAVTNPSFAGLLRHFASATPSQRLSVLFVPTATTGRVE
jgi:hypothetical protein